MEYLISVTGSSLTRATYALGQVFKRGALHVHDHVIPHPRNGYHPHVLGHRAIGLFALLLCTVKISVITVTAFSASLDPAYSSAITPERIVELTNASREQHNLSPLTYNEKLAKAAHSKAQDMLNKGYFAHTSPEGVSPWSWISQQGYSYMCAGENLAINFQESEDVDSAWMNSPGHKANIVSKCFEEIGVGVAQGVFEGHNTIFVVQMFGAQAGQPVTLKNEPTKVAPQAPTALTKPVAKPAVPAPLAKPVVENNPAPLPTEPEGPVAIPELAIYNHNVEVVGSLIRLTVRTSDSAVKALATYGHEGVFLKFKGNNVWEGYIPLEKAAGNALQVRTYDIKGVMVTEQVANFTKTVNDTYGPLGSVQGERITIFGKTFNPKNIEHNFYLLFVAGLLTCLAIAIAVHRHVQHVQLVANTSFVTVLAMMLWLG